MNYTKLVREYCKNNSGAIFDVSKLKNTEFADVPYKTLLKIPVYNEILNQASDLILKSNRILGKIVGIRLIGCLEIEIHNPPHCLE